MFIDPRIADAKPLIVVGPPRCGTRFVTNAFNEHPRIYLNYEIPGQVIAAAIRYLKDTAGIYEEISGGKLGKRRWAEGWREGRHTILYAMWSTLGKFPAERLPGPISWYGYKTPYHEQYWRFYCEFFGELRPKFVFCIRNFVDHYLSAEAMNPQSIARRAAKYREAIKHYADMKAEIGDDVSLFVLDDLPEHGIDYVRAALFDNLRIPVDDETLSRIAPERPANDSAGKSRSKRPLTAKEEAFIQANPDLLSALDKLRAER